MKNTYARGIYVFIDYYRQKERTIAEQAQLDESSLGNGQSKPHGMNRMVH